MRPTEVTSRGESTRSRRPTGSRSATAAPARSAGSCACRSTRRMHSRETPARRAASDGRRWPAGLRRSYARGRLSPALLDAGIWPNALCRRSLVGCTASWQSHAWWNLAATAIDAGLYGLACVSFKAAGSDSEGPDHWVLIVGYRSRVDGSQIRDELGVVARDTPRAGGCATTLAASGVASTRLLRGPRDPHRRRRPPDRRPRASVYAWGLLCGLACGVLGARAVLRWVEP